MMAIPIVYNTRHLRRRWAVTLITAVGIGLTVAIAVFIMALLAGLNRIFVRSGDRLDVLVIRKGAQSELQSVIDQQSLQTIKFLPGVARNQQGEPLASGEMVVVVVLTRNNDKGETNISVRGMTRIGIELRPQVHIIRGRWFNPGQREIAVSQQVSRRFAHAGLGDSIQLGKGKWTVVGVFDAGESAFSSELWTDVNQMFSDFDRETFSSVLVRATDSIAAQALKNRMTDDQRIKLDSFLEPDYYEQQTKSGMPIRLVGTLVALIMAIGSCFAGANTMYSAVAARDREIATLRILGFSRSNIVASFIVESVLLSLLGGAIGLLLIFPLNGMSTGTSNPLTFSEAVFKLHITWAIAFYALCFAAVVGLFGAVAPAWQAARKDISAALRD